MRLSEQQLKILSAVHLDARASVAELAKKTLLRAHTVRRALATLQTRQLINPYCIVNVSSLGLTDYGVFIRRLTESELDRKRFVDLLKSSPNVCWLVETAGAFQYMLSFLCHSSIELDSYISSLGRAVSRVIRGRSIATRIRWQLFPLQLPSVPARNVRTRLSISYSQCLAAAHLDELDVRVLTVVCREARASYAELARKVKLPVTTFQYRVQKLLDIGVIVGFAHDINYTALGLRKYMLIVYERSTDPEFSRRFECFCAEHPRITTCLRSLGEWNYEIDVYTTNGDELADIRQQIFEQFGDSIADIEVVEYLTTHKLMPYSGTSVLLKQDFKHRLDPR